MLLVLEKLGNGVIKAIDLYCKRFSYKILYTKETKELYMKLKLFLLLLISVLFLAACGDKKLDKSITLLNQNKEEISFPLEKPTLFFFITSYT
jgi:hypothetical protein